MTEYVELHAHSYYSLLEGASPPEDLLRRAVELGMDALALTDHDAVYGAVPFVKHARELGIRPILGAELTLAGESDPHHLTLLVENATGWANLCQLITLARHHAPKGEALVPEALLAEHTDGLIALSGCRLGAVTAALRRDDPSTAVQAARHYRDMFRRDHFYIELQHHRLPHDERLNAELAAIAEQIGVPCVATNNVHYARREASRLQDVLVCIRHLTPLDDAAALCRPNSEYYLKSTDEMRALFAAYPEAIRQTRRIADRCAFDLTFGLQELPVFPTPDGTDAVTYLKRLCLDGLNTRQLTPTEPIERQLTYELGVIERSGLANYFLIVWDIVRYARAQGILCQGRGSAANSLVAYLLHISPVNPLEHDLVFERFLSDERQSVPDIDIDFQADRREEVIQYVYGRYGHAHAAPELLPSAVYGLTEHARDAVAKTQLVANPGCYPTSILLALKPLLAAGLVDRAHTVVCDSKSGVSGAGKTPSARTIFGASHENFLAYGVGTHRHAPEIRQEAGLDDLVFTPHLLPVFRGILSTIYVKPKAGAKAAELRACLASAYAGERFVKVFSKGQPELDRVQRTNECHVAVADSGPLCVLTSAIDNLVKGAAGQALQNMNLMLGCEEAAGLS